MGMSMRMVVAVVVGLSMRVAMCAVCTMRALTVTVAVAVGARRIVTVGVRMIVTGIGLLENMFRKGGRHWRKSVS